LSLHFIGRVRPGLIQEISSATLTQLVAGLIEANWAAQVAWGPSWGLQNKKNSWNKNHKTDIFLVFLEFIHSNKLTFGIGTCVIVCYL
jgi:hypothetical protein